MKADAVDPDLALVRQARAGEYAAFEALVTRYEGRVYALARRIVREPHSAEDVVQETFLSVLEHLKDFREESRFFSWIARIATNAALKHLRKGRSTWTGTGNPDGDDRDDRDPHPSFIAPWQDEPSNLAERHEVQHLLEEALQQLDEKYRLVFLLRDVEDLSIEETADALHISAANVKIRLMRARLMLRELLTRKLGDPAQAVPPHRHE
jgi:RNA polymerase sigma-70 factor (ECF subfamily)